MTGLRRGKKRGHHGGHPGTPPQGIHRPLGAVPAAARGGLGGAPHKKSVGQEAGPHGAELNLLLALLMGWHPDKGHTSSHVPPYTGDGRGLAVADRDGGRDPFCPRGHLHAPTDSPSGSVTASSRNPLLVSRCPCLLHPSPWPLHLGVPALLCPSHRAGDLLLCLASSSAQVTAQKTLLTPVPGECSVLSQLTFRLAAGPCQFLEDPSPQPRCRFGFSKV